MRLMFASNQMVLLPHLEVADTKGFAQRLPEIFQAFIECAAFVNFRRLEQGEPPILALILL